MKLQSLLAALRRCEFWKRDKTSFHDLPNEIVFLISEHLPLYSQILLAQTCKSLRELLRLSCNKQRNALSQEEQKILSCDFADVLEETCQWICASCKNVHSASKDKDGTWDAPGSILAVAPAYKPIPRPCDRYMRSVALSGVTTYALKERHVQMALRYWRNRSNKAHLAALLTPHMGRLIVRDINGDATLRKYHFEPYIIEGHFILYSRREFAPIDPTSCSPYPERTLTTEDFSSLNLCPHVYQSPRAYGGRPQRRNQLTADLENVLGSEIDTLSNACPKCPTDYCIVKNDAATVVEIWQDFGDSDDMTSPGWYDRVWNASSIATSTHEAGAVRALFEKWYESRPEPWMHQLGRATQRMMGQGVGWEPRSTVRFRRRIRERED